VCFFFGRSVLFPPFFRGWKRLNLTLLPANWGFESASFFSLVLGWRPKSNRGTAAEGRKSDAKK